MPQCESSALSSVEQFLVLECREVGLTHGHAPPVAVPLDLRPLVPELERVPLEGINEAPFLTLQSILVRLPPPRELAAPALQAPLLRGHSPPLLLFEGLLKRVSPVDEFGAPFDPAPPPAVGLPEGRGGVQGRVGQVGLGVGEHHGGLGLGDGLAEQAGGRGSDGVGRLLGVQFRQRGCGQLGGGVERVVLVDAFVCVLPTLPTLEWVYGWFRCGVVNFCLGCFLLVSLLLKTILTEFFWCSSIG